MLASCPASMVNQTRAASGKNFRVGSVRSCSRLLGLSSTGRDRRQSLYQKLLTACFSRLTNRETVREALDQTRSFRRTDPGTSLSVIDPVCYEQQHDTDRGKRGTSHHPGRRADHEAAAHTGEPALACSTKRSTTSTRFKPSRMSMARKRDPSGLGVDLSLNCLGRRNLGALEREIWVGIEIRPDSGPPPVLHKPKRGGEVHETSVPPHRCGLWHGIIEVRRVRPLLQEKCD